MHILYHPPGMFPGHQLVSDALHAAINAGRAFSFYFAGFPEPRKNPYGA